MPDEMLVAMLGLEKGPMARRSGWSWMMKPGSFSMLPMNEMPERTGVVGNASMMGFSMLSPFWRSTIVV